MDEKSILLYADGASRGNPGHAGIGVFICDQAGNSLKEISEYIGQATNNVAEYTALLKGLQACVQIDCNHITVYMDSQLVVRQLNGQYKVKNEKLRPLYETAVGLKQQINSIEFNHIPREQNKKADALANKALDER